MRLSTRGRYAVMALVELASRAEDRQLRDGCPALDAGVPTQTKVVSHGVVSLSDIAQAQLLSVAYLEQIFARLRRAGLVESARGPGGGYRLAQSPERISIGAIIEAVDESIATTRCDQSAPGCLAGMRCLTHDLWHELGQQIDLFLKNVTLADVLSNRISGRARPPGREAEAP